MDFVTILITAGVIGGVGLVVGLFLGFAGKALHVEVNELEVKVRECLPSNNCGGCGYASCDALAKAIAAGEAAVNTCPVGGEPVGKQIAAIMGTEAGESVKKVAHVRCAGTCEASPKKSEYTGIADCRAAALAPSKSGKGCIYGCMGYGSCASVCPKNAITVIKGVAHIDEDLCVGCGACAKVCPNGLIEIIEAGTFTVVDCSSKDKLKAVKEVCSAGCLSCGVCAKLCPEKAITMVNNLPQIDRSRCVGCGTCNQKCPTKAIKPFDAR